VKRSVYRVVGAAVLAVVSAAALTACGKPAGVDGNLTNGWAMLPEAKIAVPVAPACYSTPEDDVTSITKWPEPVECTASHNVELIYVGQFTGSDADGSSAPSSGSPGLKKAYEECAARAKTFLGDDWRTGSLALTLDVPIAQQWDAGARYYRCDLQQYKDLETYAVADRTSSLKDSLKDAASDAHLGCLTVTETAAQAIDKMLPIACTSAHNGEFAGIFDNPDGNYPDDANARKTANLNGCRGVVSAYAGIPNDTNFTYRTGQVAIPFTKASWEQGNRGVRCYIWLNKNVSKSLKGAGTGGLPINYN
jgi:hypothetical protein